MGITNVGVTVMMLIITVNVMAENSLAVMPLKNFDYDHKSVMDSQPCWKRIYVVLVKDT